MTIRRDDLVAAAAVGLLQYRQIDPLLVFLLQRDVVARRQAMLDETHWMPQARINRLLTYVLAMLAIITAALLTVVMTSRAMHTIGTGALAVFSALYLLTALAVTSWFRRRGYRGRLRMLGALVVAVAPLAVLAIQNA